MSCAAEQDWGCIYVHCWTENILKRCPGEEVCAGLFCECSHWGLMSDNGGKSKGIPALDICRALSKASYSSSHIPLLQNWYQKLSLKKPSHQCIPNGVSQHVCCSAHFPLGGYGSSKRNIGCCWWTYCSRIFLLSTGACKFSYCHSSLLERRDSLLPNSTEKSRSCAVYSCQYDFSLGNLQNTCIQRSK